MDMRKAVFSVETPDPDSEIPLLREAAKSAKLGPGSCVKLECPDGDLIYVRIKDRVLLDRRSDEQKKKDGY
jgi:hypothetical protein